MLTKSGGSRTSATQASREVGPECIGRKRPSRRPWLTLAAMRAVVLDQTWNYFRTEGDPAGGERKNETCVVAALPVIMMPLREHASIFGRSRRGLAHRQPPQGAH